MRVPDKIDTGIVATEALKQGVVIEPGEIFFADRLRPRNFMRLGYSSIDARQIDEGVRILAGIARAQ